MKRRIAYRISFENPNDHLLDITLHFRARTNRVELTLPAWRPGRYLIQNYAANVREWMAQDASGQPLKLHKIEKSRWALDCDEGADVEVRYRFFAGVIDAGSSFVANDEIYFNGSNLFMMVEGDRSVPITLEVGFPPEWEFATQLERDEEGKFEARDYDHLIDSPFLASPTLRVHTFTEAGCDVTMAFQGGERIDTSQFIEPVRRIVAGHARLFQGLPITAYRFLYHLGDRWHGVEHESSCSIIADHWELLGAGEGSDAYDHLLAITSHEFFHLWNVKRIVPAAFTPYDYSVETPTRLLWLMEGVTSFYGEKMLLRSGLWSPVRYLKHLAKEIDVLEGSAGRNHLSLSQASFDAWLQEPAQMHDKINAWISFYNKGEIVGALLDIAIRRETGGEKSLDDVMRDLWTRYGLTGKGLEEDALEVAVRRAAGVGLDDFLRRYVHGTESLPYEELFSVAGIRYERREMKTGSFGGRLDSRSGKLFVDATLEGGAARSCGILNGDEILALDGLRVSRVAEVEQILTAHADSRSIPITIARNRVVSTLSIPIAPPGKETVLTELGSAEHPVKGWLDHD
ncbi:MAG TPA: hypothetical protein VNM92_17920 [Thermoanaerobaculia bacterium]|nr:hypothetical protein [Thermoanaerobaculia bacterium]